MVSWVELSKGNFASGTANSPKLLKILDTVKGTGIHSLYGHISEFSSFAVLSDGYLASGGAFEIKICYRYWIEISYASDLEFQIDCLAVLPGGNLASSFLDKKSKYRIPSKVLNLKLSLIICYIVILCQSFIV